jgi:hypothetical protein
MSRESLYNVKGKPHSDTSINQRGKTFEIASTFLNLVNAIPTPAKVAILVALYLIASTMEYNDCINMGVC